MKEMAPQYLKNTINTFYGDTSRTQRETLKVLEEVKEMIEVMIDMLNSEIE